jgi:hypothetical protein
VRDESEHWAARHAASAADPRQTVPQSHFSAFHSICSRPPANARRNEIGTRVGNKPSSGPF